MNRTVSIEILVDAPAAEALADADTRARIGRLVSQVARLHKGPDHLRRFSSERLARPNEEVSQTRRSMQNWLPTMRNVAADRL
jgi:hypothetical protein